MSFLRVSGLTSRDTIEPEGFSLWRPDLPWWDSEAEGPKLEILPKNLWLLGPGHLGQAYLWNLSLLPFAMPADVKIPLQEFDSAVPGNFSAQLLCEPEHVGKKKIRISAAFLEARGFRTTICERPFDETTKRQGEEPFVALAGFDAAPPRRCLESGGFDLVIGCALGEDSAWFDRILLHTFPNAKRTAADIWEVAEGSAVPKELVEKLHNEEDCGILAATLAGKAVS